MPDARRPVRVASAEAGIVAIGVIAALGVVSVLILTVVVHDRTTGGYAVHL